MTLFYIFLIILHDFTSGKRKMALHKVVPWGTARCIIYRTLLVINCKLLFLKVKQAANKSWKSTYQKGPNKEYTPKTIRSQHLNDDEETEVERDDMVEGT